MSLSSSLAAASVPFLLDEPMSRHTTFRIGGPADLCVMPQNQSELITALRIWGTGESGCPLCVLGNGSNVLFADEGFRGMVILTGGVKNFSFSPEESDGTITVTADCGVSLTALAAACVRDGRQLSGLAFAYGIPGSVGGAVVMNAGAYGGEMSQVVTCGEGYDTTTGEIVYLDRAAHCFGYRHSVYTERPELVMLRAHMTLHQADRKDIRADMDRNMAARQEKQPLSYPSAGSIFKRPAIPGVYVGKLVEECGLKGFTVGGAQISTQHAGFIINLGGATASDVLAVIEHVKKTVWQTYGIELVCEVRIIGGKQGVCSRRFYT